MPSVRVVTLVAFLFAANPLRADTFDYYTNPVLAKTIQDVKYAKPFKEITSNQIGEIGEVLADTSATVLIVRTNDDHFCKLLVHAARQRFGKDRQVPMLLVEKFVTFKEATERTVKAKGDNVQLYPGTRFQLDLGQVVTEELGGDLIVELDKKHDFVLKPLGEAKIYGLIKPVPDLVPKKAAKLTIGATFEIRYFTGKYKLYDDGRRSGQLNLDVNESGEITGAFYSDRDGTKYDVTGKVGNPRHAISFTIKFPQVEQTFNGFLFTGNGKAIAGTTKLQEREAGFYAERTED